MNHPVLVQVTDKIFVNMNSVSVVRLNQEGTSASLQVGSEHFQVENAYLGKFATVLDEHVKPARGEPGFCFA